MSRVTTALRSVFATSAATAHRRDETSDHNDRRHRQGQGWQGGAEVDVLSIVLVSSELSRYISELDVPGLLLFNTLWLLLESTEEVGTFLGFLISVGLDNLREVFLESEVCPGPLRLLLL